MRAFFTAFVTWTISVSLLMAQPFLPSDPQFWGQMTTSSVPTIQADFLIDMHGQTDGAALTGLILTNGSWGSPRSAYDFWQRTVGYTASQQTNLLFASTNVGFSCAYNVQVGTNLVLLSSSTSGTYYNGNYTNAGIDLHPTNQNQLAGICLAYLEKTSMAMHSGDQFVKGLIHPSGGQVASWVSWDGTAGIYCGVELSGGGAPTIGTSSNNAGIGPLSPNTVYFHTVKYRACSSNGLTNGVIIYAVYSINPVALIGSHSLAVTNPIAINRLEFLGRVSGETTIGPYLNFDGPVAGRVYLTNNLGAEPALILPTQ